MQTGSGFIKMEEANSNSNSNTKGRCFEIAADPDVNAWNRHASDSSSGSGTGKGNPATNDWIPSAQTHTVRNMCVSVYVPKVSISEYLVDLI